VIFGHPPTVGKYLAGGFNKTQSLAGTEPPNRVVLLQFGNMDAVKAWRQEGEADLENDVGEKYAKFRACLLFCSATSAALLRSCRIVWPALSS
jgi:hypothetical protein